MKRIALALLFVLLSVSSAAVAVVSHPSEEERWSALLAYDQGNPSPLAAYLEKAVAWNILQLQTPLQHPTEWKKTIVEAATTHDERLTTPDLEEKLEQARVFRQNNRYSQAATPRSLRDTTRDLLNALSELYSILSDYERAKDFKRQIAVLGL